MSMFSYFEIQEHQQKSHLQNHLQNTFFIIINAHFVHLVATNKRLFLKLPLITIYDFCNKSFNLNIFVRT